MNHDDERDELEEQANEALLDEEDDGTPADQTLESTDARWWAYKERTPEDKRLDWGAWLRAGQPVPEA